MRLLSISECSDWLNERGVGFSPREYPLVDNSEVHEFRIADDTRQAMLLAYLFGDLEKTNFSGGILMFREWNIISPGLNTIGHQIVRSMLGITNGIGMDKDMPPSIQLEISEGSLVPALLLQAMFFGWDAFYVPTSGAFVLFVSHDEVVYLASRDIIFSEDVRIQIEGLSRGIVAIPSYLSLASNKMV